MKFQLTYENYNHIRDNAKSVEDYKYIYHTMWNTFRDGDYQDMIRIILDFECTRLRNKYYRKYRVREGFFPSLSNIYDDVQEFILTINSVFDIEETSLIEFFSIGFVDVLFCNGRLFDNIDNLEEEIVDCEYYYNRLPDSTRIFNISSRYEDNDIAIYVYDYLKYLYNTTPIEGRDELVLSDTIVYGIEDDTYYFSKLKGDLLFYVYNV